MGVEANVEVLAGVDTKQKTACAGDRSREYSQKKCQALRRDISEISGERQFIRDLIGRRSAIR